MACTDQWHERIALMATGQLEAEGASGLLQHLQQCRECSAEFDVVAELLAAVGVADAEARTAPVDRFDGRAGRRWRRLWLLAAAASIGALLWFGRGPAARPLAELARIEPVQVLETQLRGDEAQRGPEFAQGLAAYRDRDYAAAVQSLAAVVDRRPDDALPQLYLGIAHLQAGAARQALAPLAAAAAHGAGLVRERALWYRANAQLLLGDAIAARAALQQLRLLGGDYAGNAATLLRDLEGR